MSMEATANLYSSRYQTGNKKEFDRESAWWAFDFVANWMNINYRNMSVELVAPAVQEWQEKMFVAAASGDTATATRAQTAVVEAWWALADLLVVRYNDGEYNFAPTAPEDCKTIGYPVEYLRDIGFSDRFVFPQYFHNAGGEVFEGIQKEINHTISDLNKFLAHYNITIAKPVHPVTPLLGMSLEALHYPWGSVVWSGAMLCVGALVGISASRLVPSRRIESEAAYRSLI